MSPDMAWLGNQPGVEVHGRHELCTSTFEKMPGNGFPSTLFCDINLFKGPLRLNLRRCQIDSLERGNDRSGSESWPKRVAISMSAWSAPWAPERRGKLREFHPRSDGIQWLRKLSQIMTFRPFPTEMSHYSRCVPASNLKACMVQAKIITDPPTVETRHGKQWKWGWQAS